MIEKDFRSNIIKNCTIIESMIKNQMIQNQVLFNHKNYCLQITCCFPFIQIISMGQQCCSEDIHANKVYTNTRDSFFQKEEEAHITKQDPEVQEYVRNFVPVDRLPKLHPQVAEIEDFLKPFHPSETFIAPQGVSEPRAYAINNEGLVYDANGEWRDGLPCGRGRLLYRDGSLYDGYFQKGVPDGEGRFISSQGWYYEGELQKEQAQGQGVFVYEKCGYRYEGQWAGDYPDGKGRETWARGGRVSSYEGQFVRGEKHGSGKYRFQEEWEYEGTFSNNQITGKGTMRYRNGETYTGDFKEGKKDGFGIYKWADGSFYEGWYVDDKKEGHGKFRTADNKIFDGNWEGGKREGKGVLIIAGKMYPGVWVNDQPSSKTAF